MGHQNAKRALPKKERKLGTKCVCGFCNENTLRDIVPSHSAINFQAKIDPKHRGKENEHWSWNGPVNDNDRPWWLTVPAWKAAHMFYLKTPAPVGARPCHDLYCVNPYHCRTVNR